MEAPDYGSSGLLAKEALLEDKGLRAAKGDLDKLYHEPEDARMPDLKWRLYVLKGNEVSDFYHVHRQSCYKLGRDRNTVDIPTDHPSCSKEHCVIQFRSRPGFDHEGNTVVSVKPYLLDLSSTNGTFLNGRRIESLRYYELKLNSVIKTGFSSREYVVLMASRTEKVEKEGV